MATKSVLILEMITRVTPGRTLNVVVNDGSNNINLRMDAVDLRVSREQFETSLSVGVSITDIASNFIYAWNLDHVNVGGLNNLRASYTTNNSNPAVKITLDNESWQFGAISGTAITSDEIQPFVTNETVVVRTSFSFTLSIADCTTATYALNIIGGVAPFTISGANGGDVVTSSRTPSIQINRGLARTISIVDSNGTVFPSRSIVPPKILNEADFTIKLDQESGAKVTAYPNVVLDPLTLPVTYSIDGTNYNGTGIFEGLSFNTQYTLRIKDAFDCVKTKTFITPSEITGGDTVTTNYARYFEISNAGSAIFSKLEGTPTNYNNALSFEELVKLPFETTVFQYSGYDFVGQFKSSYSYHKITLIENGAATYIDPVLQVQNLGLQEKVDCKLFRDINGNLGVYFRNGANYTPNTTTVDGTSPYDAINLPSWARSGTVVVIDGIGSVTINRVTTDSTRGLYLKTSATYTSTTDADGKIQANYNEQDYNTYEYIFPISSIDNCARIIIEAGFLIDGQPQIEVTYGSERIQKITDKKGFLDLSWRDPENKAGIVHQTGITNRMLLPYIKWVGSSESTSELFDADSESVSLKQEVKDIQQLTATVIGFKMQQKLQIAAGMEEFFVNGINYKKREMTSNPLKSSNWYRVEGTFELGSNRLEVNDTEIVLNPPSTPITSKTPTARALPSPLTLTGGELLNESGKTILIEE